MSEQKNNSIKGQLTLRGAIIGTLGCIVITASSAYTALKLGALPWPIVFAAVISLFFLKLLGRTSLNEANVTHTIMSAGAMVAGGLAFTIPGAWMLGLADQIGWGQIVAVALAGTALGLVSTALIHKHFMVDAPLEFPTGTAAAETLKATQAGGKTGAQLFGSMGFAGLYALLRDGLGILPAMLAQLPLPGISFGIYNSPMMLSIGFLVGFVPVAFWFGGAVIANFGLIGAGSALGLWNTTAAQGIVSSLGMGLMMGAGIATVVKDIIPQMVCFARSQNKNIAPTATPSANADRSHSFGESLVSGNIKTDAGIFGLMVAAVLLLLCMTLNLPVLVSVVVVLLSFVCTAMSAQSCGQSGIDPMEIFGLIVLLIVAAFSQTTQVQLFFVAGVVAVTCGLAGDVMNDFKAGQILGTSPRAQWLGQALGGVVGALVASAVLIALVSAYGPDAFGPGKEFVAAQASVVALMISGIPSVPAFIMGLALGVVLYWAKLPAMLVGLGVYLPFYFSLTAFIGALISVASQKIQAARNKDATQTTEAGLVVASGLLGGESIVGVILAAVSVITSLA